MYFARIYLLEGNRENKDMMTWKVGITRQKWRQRLTDRQINRQNERDRDIQSMMKLRERLKFVNNVKQISKKI